MKPTMLVALILAVFLAAGCSAPPAPAPPPTQPPPGTPATAETQPTVPPAEGQPAQAQIADPASVLCVNEGGTVSIETRPDGGQYGVCVFPNNRQCEEWAMLRGECPVGGIYVPAFATPAGLFCVITGGEYRVTASEGTADEQGTCTFKDGSRCDAWAFYNGTCSPGSAEGTGATAEPAVVVTPTGGGSAQLVFSSNMLGPYSDLFTTRLDYSNMARLTHGEANSLAGPWSPDGARIAYTGYGLLHSYVAVINADGSGVVNLSGGLDSDEGFPAWSPDGARIAFTSRRDGNNEIYVMAANGTNPVRLTDNPTDDFAPAWSPDGARIAFVSDRDREPGIYDLYIMNADGSGVTRLTDDPAIDYSPNWSPDGRRIVFRSNDGGAGEVWVMNVDGTDRRNLTNDPADDWAPTWSPDGTLIAFQTNRDGNWEIYYMDAGGGGLVNLTNNPQDDQMPFWRPAVAP